MSAKLILLALCALFAASVVCADEPTNSCDSCDFTAPDMEPENQPQVVELEEEDDDLEDTIKRVKAEMSAFERCAAEVEAYKRELVELQRKRLGVTNEEKSARLADKMDMESKAISRIREMSGSLQNHLDNLKTASTEIKEKMKLTEAAVNGKRTQMLKLAQEALDNAKKRGVADGNTQQTEEVTHELEKELKVLHEGMEKRLAISQGEQRSLIAKVKGLKDVKIFHKTEFVPADANGNPLVGPSDINYVLDGRFKSKKHSKELKELKALKKSLKKLKKHH